MLKDIAIKLRTMQLFYQMAHNLAKGSTFYQDHDAFGDYYEQASADYDMIIERAITLEGDKAADVKMQLKKVYSDLRDCPSEYGSNEDYFRQGWRYEKELCELINKCNSLEYSVGTENLVGAIADKSEARQYLISRRLKCEEKVPISMPEKVEKKPAVKKAAKKK